MCRVSPGVWEAVCLRVFLYVWMQVWLYVCMYVCMYVYVYVCVCVCLRAHAPREHVCVPLDRTSERAIEREVFRAEDAPLSGGLSWYIKLGHHVHVAHDIARTKKCIVCRLQSRFAGRSTRQHGVDIVHSLALAKQCFV